MAYSLKRSISALAEGKALGVHPALVDRATPTSIYSPGAGRTQAVISQREAMRHGDAYGGKQAIDWVYDCVGLYADPCSIAPFRLEKPDGTVLTETRTKGTPPDHQNGPEDLYKLLHQPNDFMLYDELISLLVIDLLLVGNAYWFKFRNNAFGRPLQLFRLAPPYVKIVPGQFGPTAYEYQLPGTREPLRLSPADVVHFRRPNPHSAYYGMGVIQGAGRSMDLELALTDTVSSYYENKADPSLIIQSERRVPRDVFKKLRAQLHQRASGSRNAGELLVLEAGLKADTLSHSATDALFEQLGRMSRDRIFTKFRASSKLFGLNDQTGGTDKVSDFRREFDNYALRPFMDRLQSKITAGLTSAWDVNFIIDYRTLLPPDDAVKIGGAIAGIPYIKVREVRRQYAQFGIPESTGDPEIDEKLLNEPLPPMDANGQITLADGTKVGGPAATAEPDPTAAGRRPKATNTLAPSQKALAFGDIVERLNELGKQAEAKALMNDAGEVVSVGNRLPDEKRPEDRFASARSVDINRTTAEMAAELRHASIQLERDLLDTVEGKALKTSDIVARVRNADAWKNFKATVEDILMRNVRDAASSGVMHSGRTPEDDIDYDEIAKSIVHRRDGLPKIIKTIRDRVVEKVKATRDADGERSDYQAAIRLAVADWSDSQAVTIADSEATEGYNEGTLTALEMTGESQVYVVEEEDAPDEPCQEARGQIWDIEHARANRKEHPRCRRAFLALPAVS